MRGPGAEIGISLRERRTGATVRNCEVTNFSEGVDVGDRARRNTITRNFVHHNSLIGIGLQDATGNKVTRNTVEGNGFGREDTWGIIVQGKSSGNVIDRNTASDNGADNIEVGWRTSRNRVSNNTTSGGMFGIDIGGSRQRVENNVARDALIHGMGGGEETKRSVFVGNTVTGTISGAAYRLGGSGNTIRRNVANENGNVGFEDTSVPGANTYIDNVCINNDGGTSSPEGLCSDTVLVEAEPTAQPEPAESAATQSPPAPGRIRVPELGIAVTFPDDWYVEYEGPSQLAAEPEMMGTIHSLPAGLLGPEDTAWYVAYGRPDLPGECAVQLYETSELTLDAFVDFYSGYDPSMGGTPYEITEVVRRDDMPAGEAVGLVGNVTLPFADENTPKPAVVQYAVDGGDVIAVVRCGGEPPADDWLSVVESLAETIEFLPREGDDTELEQ